MPRYALIVAIVALVHPVVVAAQPEQKPVRIESREAAVRQLLTPWNANDRPGAVVSVMIDGKVVASVSAGSADLEHRLPLSPDAVFHAASLSKQFTAFAILLLEQDGKLSIDDPASRYLPEIAHLGPVTLRQLLHHTSGIRDFSTLLRAAGWQAEDLVTNAQVTDMLFAQRGLNAKPGSAYQYINSDYVLLAEVVRRVSGMSLDAFCQMRVFRPLGMEHTHFQEDVGDVIPNRVQSYRRAKSGFRRALIAYQVVGSTNLQTTAGDLHRWARNFETGYVGGANVLARMAEQGVLNDGTVNTYAMGQDHYRFHGFETWMHGGRDAGFRSFLLRVPSEKLSVVVLGNVADLNSGLLATQVADLYLADRRGYRRDATPSRTSPDALALADYAGRYQLFPGLIFDITAKDGQLYFQQLGMGKPEALTPLSSHSFAMSKDGWLRIEFPKKSHPAPSLVYRGGYDGFIVAPRIALADFNAGGIALDGCIGRYRSIELGVEYRLFVESGHLVAKGARQPGIALRPYQPDRFAGDEWFFQDVTFERDRAGTISGFRLSGTSANGIVFNRIDD